MENGVCPCPKVHARTALELQILTVQEFLQNAYPLLEGCALFLVDWLIEGPRGYMETNPSTSPEHSFIAPETGGQQSYSTTMDFSIIQEIFQAVISSAEVPLLFRVLY